MTTSEFIIEQLKKISSLFPGMSFKYGINYATGTHVIQVRPLDAYANNEAYMAAEDAFERSFEDYFKEESILFISTDSPIDIKSTVFEIIGVRITNSMNDSWLESIFETQMDNNIDPTTNYALAA